MLCLHHFLLFIVFDSTNKGISIVSLLLTPNGQMKRAAFWLSLYKKARTILIIGCYIVKPQLTIWWAFLWYSFLSFMPRCSTFSRHYLSIFLSPFFTRWPFVDYGLIFFFFVVFSKAWNNFFFFMVDAVRKQKLCILSFKS